MPHSCTLVCLPLLLPCTSHHVEFGIQTTSMYQDRSLSHLLLLPIIVPTHQLCVKHMPFVCMFFCPCLCHHSPNPCLITDLSLTLTHTSIYIHIQPIKQTPQKPATMRAFSITTTSLLMLGLVQAFVPHAFKPQQQTLSKELSSMSTNTVSRTKGLTLAAAGGGDGEPSSKYIYIYINI